MRRRTAMPGKNRAEENFEDVLNSAEVKDFLFRAQRDLFPKMKASALSMVIGSDEPDAKLALEIGAALLFDKPLILVVQKGRKVSAALRRIAHSIVEVDDFASPETMGKLRDAIRGIIPDADPA